MLVALSRLKSGGGWGGVVSHCLCGGNCCSYW